MNIPNSENLVLVYNESREEHHSKVAQEQFELDDYVIKTLVVIPELDLKLYSRTIICRQNANDEF